MPIHSLRKHIISKEEINALPLKSYSGPVCVIDSDEKMSAVAHSIKDEKILGFDTETRPAFKKGESYLPSLVQLAASNKVYIFQLRHINSYKGLIGILSSKTALKTGVAINDDIKSLSNLFPFEPAGFIELAEMTSKTGIKNAGLRGLAALLLGFRVSKRMQCSRWDASKLTSAQITYAATDAWVCRNIYLRLLKIMNEKKPVVKKSKRS